MTAVAPRGRLSNQRDILHDFHGDARNNRNVIVAGTTSAKVGLLQCDELPTPTTTVKDVPTCPPWDLHQAAASEGGGEAIRRFIMGGGDPGAEQWGNSPLHVAAHEGHSDVVRVALNHGADVEQRNRAKQTALHLACRGSHTVVVRLLLESAANPMSVDICGRTPIDVCGDHERSHQMIELLGKSQELRELGSLKRRVHNQVCHNSTHAVEKLWSMGGSLDIRDTAQRTLLHRACEEASVATVTKLLAFGATVDATEKRRQTPLHRACERGRLDVVRLLVEQGGANPRAVAKLRHEPLHVACLHNWGSIVKYLLEEGKADVEAPDKNGRRPLHLAIEANKLGSIRELLKHGCDVEATMSDGVTRPLHIACRRGFEKSATFLLDNSADHSAPGTDGLCSLHIAAKEGKPAIVELLISRRANLHAKDDRGRTPLHSTNNRRCKERLREAERREERAAAEKRLQAEKHKRVEASRRREEELLERLNQSRSRVRMPFEL